LTARSIPACRAANRVDLRALFREMHCSKFAPGFVMRVGVEDRFWHVYLGVSSQFLQRVSSSTDRWWRSTSLSHCVQSASTKPKPCAHSPGCPLRRRARLLRWALPGLPCSRMPACMLEMRVVRLLQIPKRAAPLCLARRLRTGPFTTSWACSVQWSCRYFWVCGCIVAIIVVVIVVVVVEHDMYRKSEC
jgi:hypothetical protein